MRLTWFGPNVGYADTLFNPREIAAAGFNASAINLTKAAKRNLRDYILDSHAIGMGVCGRIVGGSLDGYSSPDDAARDYAALGCDLLTVGNEGDGDAAVNTDGSWIQSLEQWNAMRAAFVAVFGGAVPMYGVGTVTGQPDRLQRFPLNGLTGLDNHAYAQWANTVWTMLGGYDPFDVNYGFAERLMSEWGWPDNDPAARGGYVVDMVRSVEAGNDTRQRQEKSVVVGMFPYCWDRSQHVQPFFLNDPAAIAKIQTLGYRPSAGAIQPPAVEVPMPTQQPDEGITLASGGWIGPGVAAYIRQHSLTPVGGEQYFSAQASMTPCAEGMIIWVGAESRARFVAWSEAA